MKSSDPNFEELLLEAIAELQALLEERRKQQSVGPLM